MRYWFRRLWRRFRGRPAIDSFTLEILPDSTPAIADCIADYIADCIVADLGSGPKPVLQSYVPKIKECVVTDPDGFLMIEPVNNLANRANVPLLDKVTMRVAAAWRRRETSDIRWRGVHVCECGAVSYNGDYRINGRLTNSLCVHYVACHRDEIPPEEMRKIEALPEEFVTPSVEEVWGRSSLKMPTSA